MHPLRRPATALFAVCACALLVLPPSSAQSPVNVQRDNQTILRAQRCGDPQTFCTLQVNGQTVAPGASNNGLPWTDISALVKSGPNTVKVSWKGQPQDISFFVSYAATKGNFREIHRTQENVFSDGYKSIVASGARAYTFLLPAPGDPDRAGSRDRQTLLSAQGPANFAVFVNGTRLADVSRWPLTLDISKFVRSGSNTLKLKWDVDVSGAFVKVSYAPTKNKFSDIGSINLNGDDAARKPGEREIVFTVP